MLELFRWIRLHLHNMTESKEYERLCQALHIDAEQAPLHDQTTPVGSINIDHYEDTLIEVRAILLSEDLANNLDKLAERASTISDKVMEGKCDFSTASMGMPPRILTFDKCMNIDTRRFQLCICYCVASSGGS